MKKMESKEESEEKSELLQVLEVVKFWFKRGCVPQIGSIEDLRERVDVYVVLRNILSSIHENLKYVMEYYEIPGEVREEVIADLKGVSDEL